MSAEFDIRPMVEKYSSIPIGCLRVARDFDAINLSKIRRGIVFVFAAWSSPAILGFQRFTKVTQSFNTSLLDLVVVDIDRLTESDAKALFGDSFLPGGCGEAVWIRDGQVAARELTHAASEASIAGHTERLLTDHQ